MKKNQKKQGDKAPMAAFRVSKSKLMKCLLLEGSSDISISINRNFVNGNSNVLKTPTSSANVNDQILRSDGIS
jgi:hypothetical protein